MRRPATPGFIGARLVEAREARGISAIALADCLQVTRQAVFQYENSPQTPAPDVFRRICDTLGLPEAFFLRTQTDVKNDSPLFFRSMSSATKRARIRAARSLRWMRDISQFIFEYIEPPTVSFPTIDPIPLTASGLAVEAAAVEVRRAWGLGDGPISNVLWLVENHGAVVARTPLDADTLDGLTTWIEKRPYIIINSEKESAARSRFDVAHELAHLVLHRSVDEPRLNNSVQFKQIETQAHRFAAALLFPRSSFVLEAYPMSLERFSELKRRWKVSIAMMIQRAADLELIPEETQVKLWRRYNWLGWRANEPLDGEVAAEQPRLLQRSLDMLVRAGVQSKAEVVSRLGLSTSDIERLTSLPRGYFNEETADIIAIQPRLRSKPSHEIPEKPAEVIQLHRHGTQAQADTKPVLLSSRRERNKTLV